MGKRLNYRIVIEGIETERQFEVVTGIDRDLECQGYLFGRPMDEEELLERLRRDRAEKTE
jgi:EAL domain-containing protein (putative c-di-GMP-specific phosphodiesterase class I)